MVHKVGKLHDAEDLLHINKITYRTFLCERCFHFGPDPINTMPAAAAEEKRLFEMFIGSHDL